MISQTVNCYPESAIIRLSLPSSDFSLVPVQSNYNQMYAAAAYTGMLLENQKDNAKP